MPDGFCGLDTAASFVFYILLEEEEEEEEEHDDLDDSGYARGSVEPEEDWDADAWSASDVFVRSVTSGRLDRTDNNSQNAPLQLWFLDWFEGLFGLFLLYVNTRWPLKSEYTPEMQRV